MSKLTLDEAIKHCLETAEQLEERANTPYKFEDSELQDNACRECAADHRQLAEWLTELKELRNSIGAVKLKDMKEAVGLLQKLNTENEQLTSQLAELKEAKRLLKSAANVLNMFIPCDEDYNCSECIKQRQNCAYDDSFKWRYADEALKLIGGSENG